MSALLKAIDDATAEDLAQVEARIGQLESEVSALRVIERVLRAKLGVGPPPRNRQGAPTPTQAADDSCRERPTSAVMLDRRRAAAQYLAKNGAMSGTALALAIGVPQQQAYTVLNHIWFTKTGQGYHVTPEGRQACC